MNRHVQTNTFSKGMNMDLDYSLMEDSQYLYSENMRVVANEGSTFGVAQTIEGFEMCQPDNYIPYKETIIHTDVIRKYGIVVTSVPPNTGGYYDYGTPTQELRSGLISPLAVVTGPIGGPSGIGVVPINGTTYKIYRYDFTKSDISPEVRQIFHGDLNIHRPISSTCRWENENLVKFYWADGYNQLRVINIAPSNDTFNQTVDADSLNILPHSSLAPLSIVGYGGGSLPIGKIQYCYQLFNLRGSETSISPMSGIFRLSRNDVVNASVVGSDSSENSGKSIILRSIIAEGNSFEYARIISLTYKDNTSMPVIKIVDEVPINGGEVNYEDSGVNMLSELTIDQFNSLITYLFSPKVITSKDNILFAANITEDTWDVDFDARAYRANSDYRVKLNSSSGDDIEFDVSEVYTKNIAKTHDAINPYNTDYSPISSVNGILYDKQRYIYGIDSYGSIIQGGTGPNVSYRFIYTDLVEDASLTSVNSLQSTTPTISALTANINSLRIHGGSGGVFSLGDTFTRAISYGDPSIDSLVRGYQRDEVYRFGLVFYNNQNVASSVHWIGDIRMPHHFDRAIFETGAYVELTNGNKYYNQALVTHPLGLEFNINNIPTDVVGVEIVRAKRTYADRSIALQGAVSKLGLYKGHTNDANIIRPYQYLTWSDPSLTGYATHRTVQGEESIDTHYFDTWDYYTPNVTVTSKDTILFTSPEIGVMRDGISNITSSINAIEPLYRIHSKVQGGTSGRVRTFVSLSGNTENINDGEIYEVSRSSYNSARPAQLVLLMSNSDNASQDVTDTSSTLAKYYQGDLFVNRGSSEYGTAFANVTATTYIPALDWNSSEIYENLDLAAFSIATSTNLVCNSSGVLVNFSGNSTWPTYSEGHKEGLGGPWLALVSPDAIARFSPYQDMPGDIVQVGREGWRSPSSTLLCNLRKPSAMYGGDTYSSRNNTTYITTGMYSKVNTSRSAMVRGFGGDTYIGIYDYLHNSQWYLEDAYTHYKERKNVHSAYIPCESNINVLMLNDSTKASRTYNVNMQNNITVIGGLYNQAKPRYSYDDVYSREGDAKLFVNKGLYSIDDLVTDARILYSEPKTNSEVSDSWTKFRPANYLDLETEHGSINQLVSFGENLFAFQSDALALVPVNERSLIQDNNPGALTLGTGTILSRSQYITKKNGLYLDDLRSVTQSDSTLYWYDRDRFEICAFNGQLQTLSKIKGVQTYLTQNKDIIVPNPNVVYDKKYNEVLFTLQDKTLVFNEQIGAFTSFYTYRPSWYFEFRDHLYTFDAIANEVSNLYLYNAGVEKNLYDDKSKITKLQFVVNKDYTQSKTFDNIQYGADVTWGTNLDNIVFDTKRQTSFITKMNQIDYREDTYKFAIPRSDRELNEIQELVNKSYRDRMKGKYLISYYEYDNNNGRQFKLPYINTYFRHSFV